MYKFIDTTQVSGVAFLPSEALKINGQFIEDIIAGYRTVNVAGREALSAELNYYETGVRDGSKLKSKRYPARVITVTYQLVAHSCTEFRTAFNKLGEILNVEDAELIFNDEPDKYYIGTPETIGDVPAGRNSVIGEFEILCLDPFKYSIREYEAIVNNTQKSVVIDYGGTYKSYPILAAEFYNEKEVADDGETAITLTGKGDCGYVAFFTEEEKIIQLGDPEEVDGTGKPDSQTLMNQTFLSGTAWGTTAKKLWTVNKGYLPVTVSQVGSVAMMKKSSEYFLGANNHGSGTGWHGATITRRVSADSAGVIGATHFLLQSQICVGYSQQSQIGAFEVQVSDVSGANIAGIRIVKNKSGKSGSLIFYVNGKAVHETVIDLLAANCKKQFYIRRNGENVQFNFNSYIRHFTDASIKDVLATYVTYSFEAYGTKEPLFYNGVRTCKFTKNNCGTWNDVPNKFSACDVLEADCKDGEIYLNGIAAPELGALGNDWEDFALIPGLNSIGVSYSSWLADSYAPTLKVKYREVYL